MLLFFPSHHEYGRAFELQGQSVEGEFLFLDESYLSSHIVIIKDEVPLNIILRHYLPS